MANISTIPMPPMRPNSRTDGTSLAINENNPAAVVSPAKALLRNTFSNTARTASSADCPSLRAR